MFQSYTCELQTEGAYFAGWFHRRIAECVIGNGMREIVIDEGHGRARFEPPKVLQDFGNVYQWQVIEHDGYPDQPPEIAAELLALLRLDERCIYFRAVPLAPGRLIVELYCAGAEIADVWRCLLDNLAADYGAAPAGTVDQVGTVDSETDRDPRAGAYDRVIEMHRLLKASSGYLSWRRAAQLAGTDPRTYEKYCSAATGEKPIKPYR